MDKSPGATSAAKPTWKKDCEKFRKARVPFKVTNIKTAGQRQFILDFATRHHLTLAHGDGTIYLAPRTSA